MTTKRQRGILLLSDDVLVRRGLVAAIREQKCFCVAYSSAKTPRLDTLLAAELGPGIHLFRGQGTDRYEAIETLRLVVEHSNAPDVFAILPDDLPDIVLLRVVEAGATVGYPYSQVALEPSVLIEAAQHGNVDPAARLPTRWALRESLGFAWDGDLHSFLKHVERLPLDLWLTDRTQDRLPVSRRQLANVRSLARELAGLPAPDFHRYASSQRPAPVSPEWTSVRALVQSLWGHDVPIVGKSVR